MILIKDGAIMLTLCGSSLKFEPGDILVGVVLPLLFLWGQGRVARRTATVELLKDFQSPEISQARGDAIDFIRTQLPDENAALDSNPDLAPEIKRARRPVHAVTRFFMRLRALQNARLIDGCKAWKLFGPHFAYWWGYTFEHQNAGRQDWLSGKEIEKLHRWFLFRRWCWFGRRKQWAEWLENGRRQRRKDEQDYGQRSSATVELNSD